MVSSTGKDGNDDEHLSRGTIVWASDRFKKHARTRPWLIISNENHPYSGNEYIALPLTTVENDDRIQIGPDEIKAGELKKVSYVTPWAYSTLQADDCEEVAAQVVDGIVEDIRNLFLEYTK